MIGHHLLIDGVFNNPINGEDLDIILTELPNRIGMKILSGPIIVKGCPENPGWTGFVIIDKSHISIHTFSEGNRISLDVFSCEIFKEKIAVEYIKEHISFSKFKSIFIERNEE